MSIRAQLEGIKKPSAVTQKAISDAIALTRILVRAHFSSSVKAKNLGPYGNEVLCVKERKMGLAGLEPATQ